MPGFSGVVILPFLGISENRKLLEISNYKMAEGAGQLPNPRKSLIFKTALRRHVCHVAPQCVTLNRFVGKWIPVALVDRSAFALLNDRCWSGRAFGISFQ